MTMDVPGTTDELHDDANASVVAAIAALVPDDHVPVGASLAEFVNLDAVPPVTPLARSNIAGRPGIRKSGRRAALVGTALWVKVVMGVSAAAALGVGVEIADIADVPVIHDVVQVIGIERIVEETPVDEGPAPNQPLEQSDDRSTEEQSPPDIGADFVSEDEPDRPDASGRPESPGNSGTAGQPDDPGKSGSAGQPESPGESGSAGQPDDPGNPGSVGPPESPGNSGSAGQPDSPGNSGEAGPPDHPGNAGEQGPPDHANGEKKP